MLDEAREEQAALYVLGRLEAVEAERFAAELRQNPELQALVDDLEDSAASLAHAAPVRTPPTELKLRIMAELRGDQKIIPFKSRGNFLPWAVAAAITVTAALLWMERQQIDRDRKFFQQEALTARAALDTLRSGQSESANGQAQQLAALQQEVAELRQRDALASVEIATLSAQVQTYAKALAVVVWDGNTQRGVLKLEGFPSAGAGKDYQLWVIDPNRKTPVSAGVVPISAGGVARVAFEPVEKVDTAQQFAISIERAGGAASPQGQIVAVGK